MTFAQSLVEALIVGVIILIIGMIIIQIIEIWTSVTGSLWAIGSVLLLTGIVYYLVYIYVIKDLIMAHQ